MTRKKKLLTAWLVLNLTIIWGNSLLPGHISGQISDWVKDVIGKLFSGAPFPGAPGGGLIRKTAHFLEFASLGMVLNLLWERNAKSKWLALFCGAAVACADETIQLFVPGRHGCLTDVGIDCAGMLFGIALLLAGKKIHQKQKTRKLWRKQQNEEDYRSVAGSDHGPEPGGLRQEGQHQ